MLVVIIISLSFIFQLAAAVSALSITSLSIKKTTWVIISIALFLMAIRRFLPLFLAVSQTPEFSPHLVNETIGLALSILLFIGMIGLRPLFIEQKKADMKIRLAHQRMNDIIENLPDATFVIDKDRKVIAWNRAMERLSGVHKNEILGKTGYSTCFYHEQRPILIDIALEMGNNGKVNYPYIEIKNNEVYGEAYVPKAWNNKGAYCWGSASKLLDPEGNVIGAIETVRDISERKKYEENLRQAHQRLYDIIEFLPDATFIIDQDKKVLFWNKAIENMTGIEKEKIIGRSDYSKCFYEEMRPIIIDIALDPGLASSLSYPVLDIRENEVHGEVFTPKVWNGAGAYCWIAARKFLDSSGNVIGAIESIRDITDRQTTQRKLLELNQKLEERVIQTVTELRNKDQMMILQSRQAAMGEMLGNIAHQWRQPLNVIGLSVQNLLENEIRGKLNRDYIETCVNRVMALLLQMSRTIDDFRNFFKSDKEKTKFNLKQSVTESFSFVSMSYQDQGVESVMDLADDVTTTGYPNEFSQALLNLFNNALDALVEKKPDKPRITVRVFREKSQSVITIADNAGGIDPGIIHKIFDPYFTTKEMGTGIGLYMAKTIIEKNMGGKLLVKNSGGGAEFRIELP